MCTSRTSKPARLRFKPPGPKADSRRSCVSIDSGLVWSTTCDSSPRPKKYSIAAEMLLGLIRLRGVMSSMSLRLIRSCTVRRSLRKPLRSSSQASSSIVRRRRLPRWSMSSISTSGSLPRSLQQVLDGRDQVVGPQRHLVFGDVQVELAVDAEAADPAQPIAVGVVELLVEQGLGLFQLRRIARPQPLVDPQQRLFVAGRVVFGQGVEDQRDLRIGHDLDLRSGRRCRSVSATFLVIFWPLSTMISPARSLSAG